MKPFVLDEPVDGTYWPELGNSTKKAGDYGTGYYNVFLVDTDFSMLGYRFEYIYPERHGNRRYFILSSISLPRLRQRVLMSGYPWKVIDVENAMTTLSMNLLDMHMRNVKIMTRLYNGNFSGVAYVRMIRNSHVRGNTLWRYRKHVPDDQKRYNFSSKTLEGLHKKAKERGVPWVIIDEIVYKDILEKESYLYKGE